MLKEDGGCSLLGGANQARSHTGAAMVNLQSCARGSIYRAAQCGRLSLGCFWAAAIRSKPDQWRRTCAIASAREQLHCRLRLSIVWHSIAASLRCDFRHRCGHRCGQYRYCTRCTLLHRCANRCASAASRTKRRTASQRCHLIAVASLADRQRQHIASQHTHIVGRDGGQQAPEAARDAESIGAEG